MEPISALVTLGALVLPALGAAGAGIPPLAAGIGAAGVATGSAISGIGIAGAAAANPFTATAAQSAVADGFNNFATSVADVVNPLDIPGFHLDIN